MKKLFAFIIVINLIILDVIVVDLVIKVRSSMQETSSEKVTAEFKPVDLCGTECQKFIKAEVSLLAAKPTSTPLSTPKASSQPLQTTSPTTSKERRVSYVPIPGSGSVNETNWTTISGTSFYLNKSDYPGLVSVTFEANMKLLNANGIAYLRIFDVTHGIAVLGSEVSTSSQTSVLVTSSNMSLWEGNNQYAVQAKSLTADTTVFESGRLKVITE